MRMRPLPLGQASCQARARPRAPASIAHGAAVRECVAARPSPPPFSGKLAKWSKRACRLEPAYAGKLRVLPPRTVYGSLRLPESASVRSKILFRNLERERISC